VGENRKRNKKKHRGRGKEEEKRIINDKELIWERSYENGSG